MPLKYLRLGYTETNLMFVYFIETYRPTLINSKMHILKQNMIKWLYTTSGYYDNTIKSDYMNASHGKEDPSVYKTYFNTILHFIQDSDVFYYNSHYNMESDEFKSMLDHIKPKQYGSDIPKEIFLNLPKINLY